MSAPLLRVRGLCKRFGGLVATDNVDLDIAPGEIHALIGPNGAGKTTFVSQLSGDLRQDSGTIELAGSAIDALSTVQRVHRGLARTFQITALLPDFTAVDTLALALQGKRGHGYRFFRDAWRDTTTRTEAMTHLRDADLLARADVPVGDLSHGEHKQLELALALATGPQLLLLDEPLAGLGRIEGQRMVEMLQSLRGRVGMLLVEHDLDAVFALADRISVLVYGRLIATGTAAEIRERADVREAYLGEGDA